MTDNTVFDSVFKTMVHRAPQLIIPFINEAFGRHYSQDTQLITFNDEHETALGTRIDDTVFRLEDKIYHIECQSDSDASIVVRMIEYDFAIGLEMALRTGKPCEIDFPESCVLFLRHTVNTPDALSIKINLPDGTSFDYHTKVFKAQEVGSEELFEKHLLILLPYYLMRYEKQLTTIDGDDTETAKLVAECASLRNQLELATLGMGNGLLYEQLVELIIKVSDHLLAAHDALRRKVRMAMGGEILELMRERATRLEEEALELGIEQGKQLGIEQGIEQGIERLANELRQRGVDEETIQSAIASLSK